MEGQQNSDLPKIELSLNMGRWFLFHKEKVVSFGIKTVISNHIKVSVGDMDNDSLYELENGDGFLNILIVFVAIVTKGNKVVFVSKDAFLSDDGSADIPHHIVDDFRAVGKFSVSVNIETVVFGFIQPCDKCVETRTLDCIFKVEKQGGHKSFAEHSERNEIEFFERDINTGST